jgi:hypothetical protein
MKSITDRLGWLVPLGCFLALLVVGLSIFDDYGISWDERVQRQYGENVYNHVTWGDHSLWTDRHRYYGPVIEMSLYSLEQFLKLEDTRDIFLMRHLVTFLIFSVGLVFFFFLGRKVFGGWQAGIVGCVLLALSPRIFAHAFYNSKDIPFMAVFIIGVFTLIRYLDAPTVAKAAVHGAVSALLVDIRIVGILLPVLTLGFVLYDTGYATGRVRVGGREVIRRLRGVGVYLIVLIGLTIAMWPTLWRDPLANFVRVFEGMRNFPWGAPVRYLGADVWSTQLPWHYIPVWIGVSSPLVVIGLFGIGLGAAIRLLSKTGSTGVISRRDLSVILAWLFLPVCFSIAASAVLYDAWRHMFFIYPALVLVAVGGASYLWRALGVGVGARVGKVLRVALVSVVAVGLALTAGFMLRSHPHENVYFNALTGGVRGAQGRFDLDYWGLSYRKGLEEILKRDREERVAVHAATAPGRYNADILRAGDRDRLVFVSQPHKAEYYLTNFRWQRGDRLPGEHFYSVEVDGVPIMAVRRMR